MTLRVMVAQYCGTRTMKSLYIILLFLLSPFFAALLVLADPIPPPVSTIQFALPASEGAGATTSVQLYRPEPVADGNSSNIMSKDRPAGYAGASPGGEGVEVPLQRDEGAARATAMEGKAIMPGGAAANASAGNGTDTEKAADGAAPGAVDQGTLYGAAASAIQPAEANDETKEPSSRIAPALSPEGKTASEPFERIPQAAETAGGMTQISPQPLGGRGSSASRSLMHTHPAPLTQKTVTPLDQPTATVALNKTAYLSPLAAAALKRATSASVTPPPMPPKPSGRRPSRVSSGRSAAFTQRGSAALERTTRTTGSQAGKEFSRTSSSTVSSQSTRRSSRPGPSGIMPSSAAVEGTDAAARRDSTASVAEGCSSAASSPSPTTSPQSSAASSAPLSPITPVLDPTSAVAAALLAGTVRRLTFERCDRYTQKVTITASPGDTIIVACPGAARTIPSDIESFCCKDSSARCTVMSAVRYHALYRMSSIPNFRFATGDGFNTAWRLKIPESLQQPYPTLSVAWLGPAALRIPLEATAGTTGVPSATLAIHIEERRQPDDKLALLRSPGVAGESPTEESPKKEDDPLIDDEHDEFYGKFFERTPYGLRRVSYAEATAKLFCPMRFIVSYDGNTVESFLPLLMGSLCYIPWTALLSATFTGSVVF